MIWFVKMIIHGLFWWLKTLLLNWMKQDRHDAPNSALDNTTPAVQATFTMRAALVNRCAGARTRYDRARLTKSNKNFIETWAETKIQHQKKTPSQMDPHGNKSSHFLWWHRLTALYCSPSIKHEQEAVLHFPGLHLQCLSMLWTSGASSR